MIIVLMDENDKNRALAAASLCGIGMKAKPAYGALLACLGDKSIDVRREALFALAAQEADPKLCLPQFCKLIEMERGAYPVYYHFLSLTPDAWTARLLLLALDAPKGSFRYRVVRLLHAPRFAQPEVLARLEKAAVSDDDPTMREDASYALLMLGRRALPNLIRCMHAADDGVRATAVYAVEHEWRDEHAIVPHLKALLRDMKLFTRRSALDACQRLGIKAVFARDEIKWMSLVDSDQETRNKARELFDRLNGPK